MVSGVFNFAIGPCPFRPKNQVLTKEKIRKHGFPYIHLFKQFFQAFKCGHTLILVASFCRKRLKGMSLCLAGF